MLEFLLNIVLLAIGFGIILKASDIFVDNISLFAKSLGISEFIIGLTLVAFGTSVPELVSSVIASFKGSSQLALGNLIGSNITNIGLILGLTGIISVVKIKHGVIKRDGYLMLASSILFYLFAVSLQLSRWEGILLILMYIAYLIFLFKERTIFETDFFEDYLHFFINFEFLKVLKKINENHNHHRRKIALKEFFVSAVSLIFVVLSANLIVDKSVWIARAIGVTEGFIGLTIVALGTSLPELSVSIVAAKKGQGDIALGNILGSNLVNIMFILGISALIAPIQLTKFTALFVAPFLLILSFLLITFTAKENKLKRWQGAILLGLYIMFIIVSTANQLVNNIK
jgi:cation:H+ antiporter